MSRGATTRGKGSKSDITAVEEEDEICIDCGKVVVDEDKGLQCEVCDKWFHARCQGMDEGTYSLLRQECIHWFCKDCNKGAAKLFKAVARIQVRQDRMEVVLDKTVNELKSVKEEVSKVSVLTKEMDMKIETMIEAKLINSVEEIKKSQEHSAEQGLAGLRREDVLEEIEIEKRRLNLVIMGLKEENDDEIAVKDLFMTLTGTSGVKSVVRVERIGRAQHGRIRPIRVVMSNSDSKYGILQACSDLKKREEYKRVYVTPDLTRKQQEADKILRDKLKELRDGGDHDIRIKKGKIVKNSNGREVVVYPPQGV